MNKTAKTFVMVAAALLVAGGIMVFSAFAVNGFKWDFWNTKSFVASYEEHTYTYNVSEVNALSVSNIDSDIKIVDNNGSDQITIVCYENKNQYYNINVSANGTLNIDLQNKWKINLHWLENVSAQKRTLTVYVSKSALNNLDISTVSGNIDLSNISITKDVSASSTSGDIDIYDIEAGGKLSSNSVSGKQDLQNIKAAELKMVTTSGDMTLSGVSINENITLKTVSGSLQLDNTTAKGDVSASSTSGRIQFKNLVGEDLSFNSVSGSIRGNIAGNLKDYTITANSLSGKQNIPRSGGGSKTLRMSTTSGDIDVDITAE